MNIVAVSTVAVTFTVSCYDLVYRMTQTCFERWIGMHGKLLLTLLLGAAVTSGCAQIPPVNTATISDSPANTAAFAEARQAVRACAGLPDAKAMFDRFEAIGYRSPLAPDRASRTALPGGQTRVVIPTVSHDDGDVIVQAGDGYCYVGLRSMTPQQSYTLAQILVERFGATTNAENGQGLSDHVVQAWRVESNGTPVVLIAAHKTWPWARGRWPSVPGAAVTLLTR